MLVAAHGDLGSSVVAFRNAAFFLQATIGRVDDLDDVSLWQIWDDARRLATTLQN